MPRAVDDAEGVPEKPGYKVSVTLTAAQHRQFKARAALNGEKMDTVLKRAVDAYCARPIRPPLSNEQKGELRRVNAITTLIEKRAGEIVRLGERFTADVFFKRLCAASSQTTQPSLADLTFLGLDRLHRMLNQKSGTGRAFIAHGDSVFELRSQPSEGIRQAAIAATKPLRSRRRRV